MRDGDYIQVSYGPAPDSEAGPSSCPKIASAPKDSDGNPIPTVWQSSPNWEKQPASIRKKWSRVWCEQMEAEWVKEKMEAAKPQKAKGAPATKFTTQYAVEWGLRQKRPSGLGNWRIIDRERFTVSHNKDKYRSRHHDLMLGLDVLFDDGEAGMIGIQAAGRGERATHYQRFLDRGGPETAKRRGIRVFYMVFDRGNKEPLEEFTERWA